MIMGYKFGYSPNKHYLCSMKQMLKGLSVYIIAYLVLLMIVLGLLFAYPKVELHLMLNSCHTEFCDTFLKYYSMLAEWPFYLLALLPLIWKRKEFTLFPVPETVMVNITADTHYRLFADGAFIASGPVRNSNAIQYYDRLAVHFDPRTEQSDILLFLIL